MDRNCSHIYFGDGCGKTTAAVGLCMRAAGHGKRVLFCSFLKDGTSGEVRSMALSGIEVRCCGNGRFFFTMNDEEKNEQRERSRVFFDYIKKTRGDYDLVVLDEAVDAAALSLISYDELREFVLDKSCETVVTGHSPSEQLVALFDYATRLSSVSHPYDRGLSAREGIEY